MAETEKGKDPNEAHEEAIAKGRDHEPVNLTEAANKGYEPPPSFRITTSK